MIDLENCDQFRTLACVALWMHLERREKVNIFIAFLAIGNTASLNIAILSFMRSMTISENKWRIQTENLKS